MEVVNVPSGLCPKRAHARNWLRLLPLDKGAASLSRGGEQRSAKFPYLINKKLFGNYFWQRGYFVDSVGANEEIIRRYVKHQDRAEKEEEERQQNLEFSS